MCSECCLDTLGMCSARQGKLVASKPLAELTPACCAGPNTRWEPTGHCSLPLGLCMRGMSIFGYSSQVGIQQLQPRAVQREAGQSEHPGMVATLPD